MTEDDNLNSMNLNGTNLTSMNLPAQRVRSTARRARSVERDAPVSPRIPVLMTIRADQDYDSLDADHMELMTEGLMELRPEGMLLSYPESTVTGLEGTITSLEVKGPRVILRRAGTVCSQMVFEEGRQHTSLYETPFGELSIDIQTSYLRHTLTERGGSLEMRYSISIEHTTTGKNLFRLAVKRRQR